MGADRTQHERVAVGRRIGDPLRPGHAAGATHVLDHYLLAHDLAHALRNDPAQHVGRAARRERNDHGQRLAGIILGGRRPAEGEQDAKNSGGQSRKHILSSLELAQKAQLSGPAQTINPPPPLSVLHQDCDDGVANANHVAHPRAIPGCAGPRTSPRRPRLGSPISLSAASNSLSRPPTVLGSISSRASSPSSHALCCATSASHPNRNSRTASWLPWMNSTAMPSSTLGPISSTELPDMIRTSKSMN